MTDAIGIALTGLNAATQRINASASNIANVSTPNFTPLTTESTTLDNGGVQTALIQNPVAASGVDLATEIVNIKIAEIAYRANINTIEVAGELFDELLSISDKD